MRLHVAASLYQKIKNCLQTLRFCLALPLGPTPSPSDLFCPHAGACGSCGQCGQCGQSVASRMAMQDVDNVDNLFCIVHMIHIFFCTSLFLFAWEFPPGQFVDKVDNVDALFKLAWDEVSTIRYTPLHKYLYFKLLSFIYYPHCPQHFADRAVACFACGQSTPKT